MLKDYLHEIRVFENATLTSVEEGKVVVKTTVVNSSLNYYGNAHGGYLFAMCDQVSGLVVLSTGYHAVTMQSSINYLKAGHIKDVLTITGTCLHNGKSSKIVEVLIHNQENQLIVKATFTMFVTGQADEKLTLDRV